MKTLLKLSVFASIVILFAISCKKAFFDDNSGIANSDKEMNAVSLKKWYYDTFEKTTEWKTSWPVDKKFPDWKNGNSYKLGNLEIMEFPLLKGKTRLLAPFNSYTTEEIKKVVNASLTRVVFIKNSKKEISVRQVDYIPNFEYLQKKEFDISEVAFGKKGNDFTGTMVVKNWKGDILTIRLLTNGKITQKATYKKTNVTSNENVEKTPSLSEECSWVTFCMMYQDCEVVGDVVTENCGEPYPDPNDCYDEEVCIWVEDEDPCETYGIGCEEEEEAENCQNWSQSYANSLLNAITPQIITGQSFQSGTEIGPDANGVIKKPVFCTGIGLTLHLWGSHYPHWNTKYTGVVFKTTTNATWKWNSFKFNNVSQTSGTMAQCMGADVTTNISTSISGDELTGLAAGEYSVTIKCICLFGVATGSPYVVALANVDNFNATTAATQ